MPKAIKIPPVLCCIGQAVEVAGELDTYKFKVKDRVFLYSAPDGKKLYCLKSNDKKSKNSDFKKAIEKKKNAVSEAMKLYKNWHNFEAISGSLMAPPRGFLFDVDRAVHIIYTSDKWIAKKRSYIHDFKKRPKIWVNKKTKPTLLVLTGGQIAVRKEGIIG